MRHTQVKNKYLKPGICELASGTHRASSRVAIALVSLDDVALPPLRLLPPQTLLVCNTSMLEPFSLCIEAAFPRLVN